MQHRAGFAGPVAIERATLHLEPQHLQELERLNGFPDDWTDTGMTDGRRAFMMGNALVVGLIERVGRELMREAQGDYGFPEAPDDVSEAAVS